MQNIGAVKFFAIVFGLVCIFQLSFTFISWSYSVKADNYSTSAVVQARVNETCKRKCTQAGSHL